MAQPGQFGPRGEDWLVRKVQELERTVQQLAAANPFKPMGIRPKDGGIIIDGYETVEGPLTVNGTAEFKGDTVIGGNASITGTLSLPAGIIGNDALANPLSTASKYADARGFAVLNSEAAVASVSIPVPAGYTKATVTGVGSIYLYNNAPSGNYGYGRVYVDWPSGVSDFGGKIPFAVGPNGGSGNTTSSRLVERGGLTGGAVTVRMTADSDNGIPAHDANIASIDALIIFTR